MAPSLGPGILRRARAEGRQCCYTDAYLGARRSELVLVAGAEPWRALLLGGAPFGETILMWWNFVARSHEEIVAAREDWQSRRGFGEVTAYQGSRLEAPPIVARGVAGR